MGNGNVYQETKFYKLLCLVQEIPPPDQVRPLCSKPRIRPADEEQDVIDNLSMADLIQLEALWAASQSVSILEWNRSDVVTYPLWTVYIYINNQMWIQGSCRCLSLGLECQCQPSIT